MATPKQTFTDIANAIRERTNTTDKIKPNEMASKINDIPQGGLDKIIALMDCSYLFSYYQKNTYSPPANTMTDSELANSISYSDTSKATTMSRMFYNCTSLTTIPQLDTSKVTDMQYMFSYCKNLTSIPQLDTSNVTDMWMMFSYCTKLTTIPQLDTSKVTNMYCMFYSCTSLTSIPQLDTSKVTNMSGMFSYCTKLTEINMINIGCSFSISATALGHDALVKLIGNLKSVSTTQTLTMGSAKLALLSDEEKKVATDKGWTLA